MHFFFLQSWKYGLNHCDVKVTTEVTSGAKLAVGSHCGDESDL